MRRGRDERRAEGAVTCGRATRACGAEHTFLSFFVLFLLRPGRCRSYGCASHGMHETMIGRTGRMPHEMWRMLCGLVRQCNPFLTSFSFYRQYACTNT
ncbi:hypothetical protein BCY84_12253 [Trypanosoma cruzi cruzi]|nr:hypothetical protein BCY84_12253 [Trypanosoma cruzi cruzi]